MPMPALVALAVTTLCIVAVLLATVRARREVEPTLRALDALRRDLQPALVRIRADHERVRHARRPDSA
jgi:hypothetical protein